MICTLAIMLLTSMNYALSLGYALTFLAGGMVAAALLATFRNVAGIAISPLVAGEAFAGGDHGIHAVAGRAEDVIAPVSSVGARTGARVEVDLPAGATRPLTAGSAGAAARPAAAGPGYACPATSRSDSGVPGRTCTSR